MSRFTDLILISNDDGTWSLNQDLKYDMGRLGSTFTVIVPKGFQTDLASIPRLLKPIIDNDDKSFRKPAVLHDWAYRMQVGKAQADILMDDSAKACGASWWKRFLVMSGLRVGGWVAYRKHTKAHAARMDGFKAYDPTIDPPFLLIEDAWARWGWNYKRDHPDHESITELIPMEP